MKSLLSLISAMCLSSGLLNSILDSWSNTSENNKKIYSLFNEQPNFNNMYVLGDSLSDSGALIGALGDFLAYHNWVTSGKIKFEDPFYKNRSFCTGPLAVENLAKMLNIKLDAAWDYELTGPLASNALKRSYSHFGNNYAFGGSQMGKGDSSWYTGIIRYIKENIFNHFDLKSQYGMLTKQHKLVDNDLVIIESGNNDIFNQLAEDDQSNDEQVINNAISDLDDVLSSLLNKGVKNILVTNIVDLTLTPSFRNNQTKRCKAMIDMFNDKLDKILTKYNPNYVRKFDLYKEFNLAIQSAQQLGYDVINSLVEKHMSNSDLWDALKPWGTGVIKVTYINGKSEKDIDSTFFLDDVHPTEYAQNKIGIDMYDYIKQWYFSTLKA